MYALTVEAIISTGAEANPSLTFHPTTIAYIQTLLTSYAEALEAAQTNAAVIRWVSVAFPEQLAYHSLNEMADVLARYSGSDFEKNTDPGIVAAAKMAVISYLVYDIMALSEDILQVVDKTILPWDIETFIGNDEELTELLSVVEVDKMLPIIVTVGPQSFQHMATEDFTIGLLLFSIVANVDFHITMFGVPLTSDYFLLEDAFERPSKYRFTDENNSQFRVKVDDSEYTFQTGDFMQGFHTGAIWAEVNHHDYWSELMVNQAGNWTPITF